MLTRRSSNSSSKRKTYHHQGKHSHPRIFYKNLPKFRCFTCDGRGHYARDFPKNKNVSHKKKGNKKRHHSHAAEDDELSKKIIKQDNDDSSSDEEYVLISTLMGNITHERNDWLIDSGASKHMKGFKESFVKLS